MPNIQIRTNRSVSKEKQKMIKEKLGKAITLLDGKSEKWLMVEFSIGQEMWFGGTDEPCAYIYVSLYGKGNASSYKEFTRAATSLICQELDVKKDRIYAGYFETEFWGWNGDHF